MANYKKYNRNGVPNILAHFDRTLNHNSNENIDETRTHLNYNLAPHNDNQNDFLKKRLSEVKCLNRQDVKVLTTWIVTLPKDFQGDEKAFFRSCYNFLENKYGKQNVISAWVHKDETQPHLHFAFVPVVRDQKKGHLKVSAKECVTRKDLINFHQEIQNYVSRDLGFQVNLINGSTMSETELRKAKDDFKAEKAAAEFTLAQNKKDFEKEKEIGRKIYNDNITQLKARQREIEGSTIDFGEPPSPKTLETPKNYSKRVLEWFSSIKTKMQDFWKKCTNKEKQLKKREESLNDFEKTLNKRAQDISAEVNERVKNLLPEEFEKYKPGINARLEQSFYNEKKIKELQEEVAVAKKYDYRKVSEQTLKNELRSRSYTQSMS